MNIEKTIDSIPIDLFLEIFSSLPAKSVGRCRCVSKLWASKLGRQDFTELFLTRSSTRPRLLFALEQDNGESLLFSSPQPQNPLEKSIVVAADSHTKFPTSRSRYRCNCSYASGLICFSKMRISKRKAEDPVPVICNPITGQYAILPKQRTDGEPRSFLGFDPIDKQFKVLLFLDTRFYNEMVHILTLGTGEMWWRKIQCPLTHIPLGEGICINGVLYYLAKPTSGKRSSVIVCFDVRSEKFKFMEAEFSYGQLINCKGKLGAIERYYYYDGGRPISELCMWVLEDVEKQKWSKYVYPFPKNENDKYLSVVGMTATGEIALLECLTSKTYVLYFNPERNILQRVEIQGVYLRELMRNGKVCTFVDHVEDLSVNDAKQLKSSIFDLRIVRSFESINKFDALCRLDDD